MSKTARPRSLPRRVATANYSLIVTTSEQYFFLDSCYFRGQVVHCKFVGFFEIPEVYLSLTLSGTELCTQC